MDLRSLVIDADQTNCELIEQTFEPLGWVVAWCTDGEGGLELAREQPFDAVLVESSLRTCRAYPSAGA